MNIKLPQLELYPGIIQPDDKIFVWQALTGLLKQADVSQLPFGSGGGDGGTGGTGGTGGGTGTIKPATFKIRKNDPQCSIVGLDTIINDSRLLGHVDYPVRATQLNNAAFRDSELVYDPFNAQVLIKNFSLQVDEFLVIEAPGQANTSGGTYSSIIERLDNLERIAAPFAVDDPGNSKGGMVLWNKPAIGIPFGWYEVIDWRGRLPMGYDPADPDFATISKTGGSKSHTLTIAEMPAHSHTVGIGLADDGNGDNPDDASGNPSKTKTYTSSSSGGGEAHSILNPYRTVVFIEYTGI